MNAPVLLIPSAKILLLLAATLVCGSAANIALIRALHRGPLFRAAATAFLTLWLVVSLDIGLLRCRQWVPAYNWVRALGIAWVVMAMLIAPVYRGLRRSAVLVPGRRRFLETAGMAMIGAPLAAAASAGYANSKEDPLVREATLPVADLPADLDGFRIVQVSDIHLSPFVTRRQLARAVDMANGTGADLALVTGDLITGAGDPLDDCLAELQRLKAVAGVYGCLGNHEILAGSEEYTAKQAARLGIRFLRYEAAVIESGAARVNLVGVDYQRQGSRYLQGVTGLQRSGCVNLLLSHNPDVFSAAVKQNWDAVIAGHTHGGQVTLEYLHPTLNPARFYTPFVYGLYRRDRTAMYVNAGLGTVMLPVRLGVPAEIALLTLRRATS